MKTVDLARQHGIEEGIEKGFEKGIERVTRKLFAIGAFSDREISKISELPIERIVQIRQGDRATITQAVPVSRSMPHSGG